MRQEVEALCPESALVSFVLKCYRSYRSEPVCFCSHTQAIRCMWMHSVCLLAGNTESFISTTLYLPFLRWMSTDMLAWGSGSITARCVFPPTCYKAYRTAALGFVDSMQSRIDWRERQDCLGRCLTAAPVGRRGIKVIIACNTIELELAELAFSAMPSKPS